MRIYSVFRNRQLPIFCGVICVLFLLWNSSLLFTDDVRMKGTTGIIDSSLQGYSRKASDVLHIPVYISMTTISSRIHELVPTLQSVMRGDLVPDRLYIFISREEFLLDKGINIDDVKSKAPELVKLLEEYPIISLVYTDNEGPHRKLLPLLAKKWKEDCIIVTIDDHEIYGKSMLSELVNGYIASNGSAVVALRSRRIAFCGSKHDGWVTLPYSNADHRGLWPEVVPSKFEMLVLPTGMGGVLYRPRFLHSIVFDSQLREATRTADDLAFRLSAMATGTPVYAICNRDKEPDCIDSPPPQSAALRQATYASNWKFSQRLIDLNTSRFQRLASWEPVPALTWSSSSVSSSSSASFAITEGHRDDKSANKSNRKHFRRLTSDREDEPAKKVSLASYFNTFNNVGNTHLWHAGVKYLLDKHVLDYQAFIQYAVPLERKECLSSENTLSVLFWSIAPNKFRHFIINTFYSDCGIDICDA